MTYREKQLKNVSASKSSQKTHPYYSRLNSLIGKRIVVAFNDHDLVGILLGFDSQHLNLCLEVDGRLVFVRGNSYLWFSEGAEDVGS